MQKNYYEQMLKIIHNEGEKRVEALLELWEAFPEKREQESFVFDLADIATVEDEAARIAVRLLAQIGNETARRQLQWLAYICSEKFIEEEVIKAIEACGTEKEAQWLMKWKEFNAKNVRLSILADEAIERILEKTKDIKINTEKLSKEDQRKLKGAIEKYIEEIKEKDYEGGALRIIPYEDKTFLIGILEWLLHTPKGEFHFYEWRPNIELDAIVEIKRERKIKIGAKII